MAEENLDTPESEAPVDSRHDDIARAFEEIETRDAPPDSGKPTTPSRPDAGPSASQPSGERARGPDGRFIAEGEKPPERPAIQVQTPPVAPVAPPQGKEIKPPAGEPIK